VTPKTRLNLKSRERKYLRAPEDERPHKDGPGRIKCDNRYGITDIIAEASDGSQNKPCNEGGFQPRSDTCHTTKRTHSQTKSNGVSDAKH
jgi:hypothetical protein